MQMQGLNTGRVISRSDNAPIILGAERAIKGS